MSTLNPPSFVLRYRLNRFKEALEILGSRTGLNKLWRWESNVAVGGCQHLSKSSLGSLRNHDVESLSVFISATSWICFESFVFLFAKKRPPGRAKIQRKSLAERDWKLRLGSCSSRMCCEKKMLKRCLKDALKMCGTGILYDNSWLWCWFFPTSTASACQLWVSHCSEHVLSMFCRFNTD